MPSSDEDLFRHSLADGSGSSVDNVVVVVVVAVADSLFDTSTGFSVTTKAVVSAAGNAG